MELQDYLHLNHEMSYSTYIPFKLILIRVKQCYKSPMTGKGNHITYKNRDFSGGWFICNAFHGE